MVKNALILHGKEGTSKSNWFPWLKKELEKIGYSVWVPDLPGSGKPDAKTNTEILIGGDFDFSKDTIIVGHSAGAVQMLHLLSNLPKGIKVKAAYLVGSFMNDLGWEDLKGLFTKPYDFNLIKQKAEKFIFIHSDNDPYCPLQHAEFLSKQLNGELIIIPGEKHFSIPTGGEKFDKFPELLEKIKKDE